MLKEIIIENTKLIVDATATRNYITNFNTPCDCPPCRNYYEVIKMRTDLTQFLIELGISPDRPEEVIWFCENFKTQTIEYMTYYSVVGEVRGADICIDFPGCKIDINALDTINHYPPNTGRSGMYFWVIVSGNLPWVLNERMKKALK